jgi:hypothetical protein
MFEEEEEVVRVVRFLVAIARLRAVEERILACVLNAVEEDEEDDNADEEGKLDNDDAEAREDDDEGAGSGCLRGRPLFRFTGSAMGEVAQAGREAEARDECGDVEGDEAGDAVGRGCSRGRPRFRFVTVFTLEIPAPGGWASPKHGRIDARRGDRGERKWREQNENTNTVGESKGTREHVRRM